MQILRKTDQWFEKRHEKFGKFSAEYLKCQNWNFDGIQSKKCMTLKSTEELCVMTMNNNAKFEEEFTFHFKTDSRNLTNFDSSTQKSKKKKKCSLICSLSVQEGYQVR